MNPIALVALLIAGAAAQYSQFYGTLQYGNAPQAPIPITRLNQELRGSESNSVDFETGNGMEPSIWNRTPTEDESLLALSKQRKSPFCTGVITQAENDELRAAYRKT